MRYLVVIDVQNDFVDGSLGSAEAVAMLPVLLEKVKNFSGIVIATKDVHGSEYPLTQEGRKLPVAHCMRGTEGSDFPPALSELLDKADAKVYVKSTFGCRELADDLASAGDAESVEVVGLCTDICIISNILMLKAALPEVPIRIDTSCCAGTDPERHEAALLVMDSCQIEVIR